MKRKDYISWDEYFMGVASLSSLRSKDPSTQVGACVASSQNKVLTMGYNGMPIGCSDDDLPWGKESSDELEQKYLYVCHAEFNAILNARVSLDGSRIYVTLFPCNECAKAIVQAGIKEIIYMDDKYKDTDSIKVSKNILDTCSVKYRKYEPKNKKIEIEL